MAGKPMASRGSVGRTMTHSGRFFYDQDFLSTGVVQQYNVVAKDKLADLHTKYLSEDRILYMSELHHPRSPMDRDGTHGILSYNSHIQLLRVSLLAYYMLIDTTRHRGHALLHSVVLLAARPHRTLRALHCHHLDCRSQFALLRLSSIRHTGRRQHRVRRHDADYAGAVFSPGRSGTTEAQALAGPLRNAEQGGRECH